MKTLGQFWSVRDCVKMATRITRRYAETHKGRNAQEKRIIARGYGVMRVEGALHIVALDKPYRGRGRLVIIR